VEWQVDDAVLDTGVPPLVLQPLVENAVHHGIEPGDGPGTVTIRAQRSAGAVEIEITNPRIEGHTQPPGRSGSHMALDNVRERLTLQFDVEARLETKALPNAYVVRIVLPHRAPRA
jgi:two-component system sensor histidine kinase AlgZ